MKFSKFSKWVAVAFMMTTASLCFATGATKVAVVDVQAVVLLSDAGKNAMADLEKNPEYIALKAKLDNSNAEIKALSEKAKTDSLTWGAEQKEAHSKKINELAKAQQTTVTHLNRGRESIFMQLLQAMEPGIGKAVELVMTAEGIELIIDSKTVVLKIPTADITQQVVVKLNELNAQAAANAQPQAAK